MQAGDFCPIFLDTAAPIQPLLELAAQDAAIRVTSRDSCCAAFPVSVPWSTASVCMRDLGNDCLTSFSMVIPQDLTDKPAEDVAAAAAAALLRPRARQLMSDLGIVISPAGQLQSLPDVLGGFMIPPQRRLPAFLLQLARTLDTDVCKADEDISRLHGTAQVGIMSCEPLRLRLSTCNYVFRLGGYQGIVAVAVSPAH